MKRRRKIWAWLMMLVMLFSSVPSFQSRAETEEGTTINVLDYGADPSGATDSTQAIWDALEAAKEAEADGSSVTLEFPKGEYHIYKDYAQVREYHTSNTNSIENPEKTIGILIEEHQNLTIEGNDSLFMMHGNMMALAVVKSENITLKNFSWDFAVPTVVEMTVTNVGENYTDYYIPSCFPHTVSGTSINWSSDLSPYTGEAYWSGSNHDVDGHGTYAVVGYHPEDEMTRNYYTSDGPLSNVSRIEELSDTAVRVYYSSRTTVQGQNQKEGTVFELCSNAYRQTAGAFTWESSQVEADGVNVHFMHGFGWLIQMSTDVTYKNCDFMPRENSGHITVSFADGIHASGAAGQILIENCNFSNTHDDPINLHGTFTRVEQRNDDNTLTLKYIHTQQGGFPQFHEGDQVAFYTRDTLESMDNEALYTVAEVISNPGEDGNDLRTMVVRFEETLPENLSDTISGEPKYVAENVTYAPSVTIRNNTFKNVPTRGILCTTRNEVLIEGNTFLNMSMATIYLSNDSNEWYESGPIRNMTIRNNTFYIKSIGRTAWEYAPAIYINPVTKGGGLPSEDNPIHKNITIEGNTFHMDVDTVVKAESVENLTIRNNTILRTDPDVEISVSSGTTSLAAGDTANLTTNVSGDQHTGVTDNVFEFTKCKNVVIEGNTYDDGLKKYAVLSGMSESNLTNNDSEISVVSSRSEAVSAPASDLRYVSSDPDVISVDSEGRMTAKAAGSAEVYAYYVWNQTIIKSNVLQMTVTGEGGSGSDQTVQIANEGTIILNDDTVSVQLTANIPVTWSAVDFLTGGQTDVVSVSEDGTVTAQKNGLVWVKASAGGAEDKIPVVVSLSKTEGLPSEFQMIREDSANYTLNADSITINMQTGDLWSEYNTLKNLLLYTDFDRTDLRTIVKVEGLPVNESGQWDTASFILYNDDDNYISIGKKSHYNGIATVVETAQNAVETGGNTEQDSVTEAYLGFTVTGSGASASISMDFKVGDGEWTNAETITSGVLGSAYSIGFGAWHTNDRGKTVTFSDFKAGKASEVTYADLEGQAAIAIGEYENTAPTASNAAFDKSSYLVNEKATVNYTFYDEDGDAEGNSLYLWEYDVNGYTEKTVTSVPEFTVLASGDLSCTVYPVDANGTPGTPVSVRAAAQQGATDLSLRRLSINGVSISKDAVESEVLIPADLTKVELSYAALMSEVGTTTVAVAGQTVAGTKNIDCITLAVKEGDVITVTRSAQGQEDIVYTVTVKTVESNATEIQKIEMPGIAFAVEDFSADNWFAVTEEASSAIKVTADDSIGKVEIKYGCGRENIELSAADDGYEGTIDFANGLNSIYVQVTAKDGITMEQYIINVVYEPDTTAELQDLKINGVSIENFDSSVYEYLYTLPEDAEALKVEAVSEQEVRILLNDECVEGNVLESDELKSGTNDIYVIVSAKDGIARAVYHVEAIVPYPENTEVFNLNINGKNVLTNFDEEGNATVYITEDTASVEIVTKDQEASIEAVSGSQKANAQGTLEASFPVNKETPAIDITVTARDGKTTKTYHVDLVKVIDPSDDSRDYPVEDLIAISDSQWLPGDTHEGPDDYILDGDANTHWHTNWSTTEANSVEKRWVGVKLAEATLIDGIRYLPRTYNGTNGAVTEYKVQYRTTDDGEWLDVTTGTWSANDTGWKLITFDAVTAKQVRIVGVHTYADSGNDAHMSAAEFRVTMAEAQPDPTPADKSALTAVIAEAEGLKEADYTEESFAALTEALDAAKAVNDNEAATQADVDAAKETLQEAIDALVEKPDVPTKEVCQIFTDVAHGSWYEEAVQYVYDKGLMEGNGALFTPNGKMTRGMFVTTLYRLAGEPEITDRKACTELHDVAEGAWYTDAVCWAYATGVTTGYENDMTFRTNVALSREQLATFLYRYTQYQGLDVSASDDLAGLLNADKVKPYAEKEVKWAVGAGIIGGMEIKDEAGNTVYDLAPQKTATRAQMAQILMRFCETYNL